MDTVVELFRKSKSTLWFDDGTTVSASSLADRGRAVAEQLNSLGWQRGQRIALHLPNGADYVTWLLACAAGGFVAVSVNTRYSATEVDELIERSGARRPPELAELVTEDIVNCPTTGEGGDGFVVFTTSGTTSRPKMVLHRQEGIVRHAVDVAERIGYTPSDTVLVAMPLCGTFGLTSLLAAVASGAPTIVTEYERVRTAALIEQHRVTALNASDDLFHRLLEDGTDVSTIRLGGYARFNISLDGIVARAAAAGAILTGLYGMSEVQALFAVRSPDGGPAERERAGGTLSSAQAEYRIVDGQLEVRGPSLFAGYLAEGGEHIDEALTASAFEQTALDTTWFRTGDSASADDDRTFHYLGRADDMLRLGGFLVNPFEIASVIAEAPGVDEAQVVAVTDERGSRAVAFVIAPAGYDEAALIGTCRQRLARYKVPVRIFAVEDFPTRPGPNGTKVQLVELRRLAEELMRSASPWLAQP